MHPYLAQKDCHLHGRLNRVHGFLPASSYQTVNGFMAFFSVTLNSYAGMPIADSHVGVNFQNVTMTIAQSMNHSETDNAIISAASIYVDILSQLINGVGHNSTSETLTTTCQISRDFSWN